jgi:hypothetical protein
MALSQGGLAAAIVLVMTPLPYLPRHGAASSRSMP